MSDEREITAPMEVADLQQGWEGKALPRPVNHAFLRFGAKTDLGQGRENNEDKFDLIEPDEPAASARHGRRGTMPEEEAAQSPHRNVITRSLGGAPEVEPDLYEVKLQPGDRYLICSDGLSGMVAEPDLLQVGSADSPSVAAWNLVEMANEHGGTDNVTVVVLDVVGLEAWNGAEPSEEPAVLNHATPAA